MLPLKETKVYIPVQSDELSICALDKEGEWKYQNVDVKEQTGYFINKQEIEELFNNLADYGYNFLKNEGKLYSHTNNAYQELKQQYINKLLNNENNSE